MKLVFEKKEKSDAAITFRLPKSTIDKLRKLSKHHGVSQARLIKKLIETYYSQETGKK